MTYWNDMVLAFGEPICGGSWSQDIREDFEQRRSRQRRLQPLYEWAG